MKLARVLCASDTDPENKIYLIFPSRKSGWEKGENMKKKLFAAALSLTMATILMVSSSFAWFTVSTAPEVSSIEMTVQATKNLEIAKATDLTTAPSEVTANDTSDPADETKWGGKISSLTGATVTFPAKLDSGALKTIKYAADGRTNGITTATTPPTSLTGGIGYYTADIKVGDTTIASGEKVAAVYGVWLRSNVALTDVKATVSGTVTAKHGSGESATNVKWGIKTENTEYTAAEAVKVAVDVGGTVYAPDTAFSLSANTPTLVKIIVYVDGDACIAESVKDAINISGLKVDFTSAAVTALGTQHGTTPTT